jgi:hypothetical protein
MTAATFNTSRTRIGAWFDADPAKFGVLLLRASDAAADMRDHDTVAALLADAQNTEANFTNYARKTGLTATNAVSDATDTETFYIPDQTWASAGGVSNNTLTTAVVFYESSASDAGRFPVAALDLSTTTDGSDLIVRFSTNGIFVSEDTTP